MTSREGRQTGTCRSCDRYIFQLTTSRGGRRFWYISNGYGICFSTHDLSWRSTFYWKKEMYRQIFSTHDLSWRSTEWNTDIAINSVFSTHDLSWRSTNQSGYNYLDKFFQLTTSRGGRHITSLFTVINGSFSTHDLSWRSTAKLHNKSLKFCIFSGHFILEQMSLPFSYKYH